MIFYNIAGFERKKLYTQFKYQINMNDPFQQFIV